MSDSDEAEYKQHRRAKLFAIFAFSRGQSDYGFLGRKNCEGLDMGFVTVNCPPSTAGGLVTSSQIEGGVRLSVDCSVDPVALVGQDRIMALLLRRSAKGAPRSHPLPSRVSRYFFSNPLAARSPHAWQHPAGRSGTTD